MVAKSRSRQVGSIKSELIKKSREAALTAVQIFNNPIIKFKSESYIVLMIIAWTYLLHAYFRKNNIEYRYYKKTKSRRKFVTTTHGAYKHWELEKCLGEKSSPIDKNTSNNLKFLIGLRNEIEHQMTSQIDGLLSARFQACSLNYNYYLKKLFGKDFGIENHLSFSLQFSSISEEQKDLLSDQPNLPKNILSFIQDFDNLLTHDEYSNPKYTYRILFVAKTTNSIGQADRVIEFVKKDSPLAAGLNKEDVLIKETEKEKYLPGQIVQIMKDEGFKKFNMHAHTALWKKNNAQNPGKGFGTMVANKHWHYYKNWVEIVRNHCKTYKGKYE